MPFSLIPPFRRWRQYCCKFKATLCTSGHLWLQSETSSYWQSCFDLWSIGLQSLAISSLFQNCFLISFFKKKKTKTKWSWVSGPHFFKKLFSFSLCTLVFYLQYVCERVSYPLELRLQTVTSCGFWELNAGPLEDQPVPLTFSLSTWEVEAWGSGI